MVETCDTTVGTAQEVLRMYLPVGVGQLRNIPKHDLILEGCAVQEVLRMCPLVGVGQLHQLYA